MTNQSTVDKLLEMRLTSIVPRRLISLAPCQLREALAVDAHERRAALRERVVAEDAAHVVEQLRHREHDRRRLERVLPVDEEPCVAVALRGGLLHVRHAARDVPLHELPVEIQLAEQVRRERGALPRRRFQQLQRLADVFRDAVAGEVQLGKPILCEPVSGLR